MLVLGLDTSTPACGVTVVDVTGDDPVAVRLLARREVVDARRSGEVLAPLIAEALQEAGCSRVDLQAIVAGVGPGPYTSLRVGIVTAAALADALGIPAHGVCSLDGLISASNQERVVAATDARRREIYWARYEGPYRVAGPDVAVPIAVAAELDPAERVVGAGGELYADVFGAAFDPKAARYPDPARLVEIAVSQQGGVALLVAPAAPLVPLYLRRPDAAPVAR